MSEQSPDKQQQQREEGRPDPEELLRRYSLRDSDLEVPTAPVHLTPRAGGQTSHSIQRRIRTGAVACVSTWGR